MNQEVITTALQQFNLADSVIAKMREEYMALTIKNIDDKEGFKRVHEARMDTKGKRVEVEKKRKELKEEALRYGQAVDGEAKRLTGLLAPIEVHLATEEGRIEAEKQAIKDAEAKALAEKVQARVDELCAYGALYNGKLYVSHGIMVMPDTIESATDEDWIGIVQVIAEEVSKAKVAEEAKAKAQAEEGARLKKIAEEQAAEKTRLAEEAARAKVEQETKERALEEEKARLKAKEEEILAEKERIAKAERDRLQKIEDEKVRIENEKKRQEELERAQKEYAEKALKDAEAKAKREAEAKLKKEAAAKLAAERKAARAPDKVKILLVAKLLDEIQTPDVKTEEGKAVALWLMLEIQGLIKAIQEKAEEL